jgi:hypothetical protein
LVEIKLLEKRTFFRNSIWAASVKLIWENLLEKRRKRPELLRKKPIRKSCL